MIWSTLNGMTTPHRRLASAAFLLMLAQPTVATAQGSPPVAEDQVVDRALERTLVAEGGLLLPPMALEIEPALTYSFRSRDALRIVQGEEGASVASGRSRRDVWQSALALRLGVPWNAQAQLRVPYVVDRREVVIAGQAQPDRHDSGLGDIELGLSKQLLYEHRSGFDLLGNILWSTKTGDRDFAEGLAIGSGFHGIQASLTAVERRDPLVFSGTVSYTTFLEETYDDSDIRPGQTLGFQVATLLAASPNAALRLAFELSRTRDTTIDGQKVAGTNQTIGFLELGAAATLGRRALLSVGVGFGVTEDAPDVQVTTSLNYRLQ
jgi:hypothetical protein